MGREYFAQPVWLLPRLFGTHCLSSLFDILFEWCVGVYSPTTQLFAPSCAGRYYDAIVGVFAQIVGVQRGVGSDVSIHSTGQGGSAPYLVASSHHWHFV